MAPLYKRYIPPKAAKPVVQASDITPARAGALSPPQTATPPKTLQNGELAKRKRERTDEEVAERKAKKLRKKGIDPATVDLKATSADDSAVSRAATARTPNGAQDAEAQSGNPPAQGDFTHVKDNKKRHKLEKEARKARIAAEKQAKAGVGVDEDASRQREDVPKNGMVQTDRDANAVDEHVTGSKEQETALPKRKKRRKGRELEGQPTPDGTLKETADEGRDADESSSALAHVAADSSYDQALSQPKKRRHKLEAVLEKPIEEGEPNDDHEIEHMRKHGSVLGKFQKAQKLAANAPSKARNEEQQMHEAPPVLHDLVPLPQPEKAATPDFVPDVHALPSWLANPTVVADDTRQPFTALGLHPRLAQHVTKLGFNDVLPVQQALIPLLLPPASPGSRFLPGSESLLPDIAVGAPTGSGKTIAYLLPVIEDVKKSAGSGKLKVLVTVPTRELVMQVAAVAESLAKGSKVKIGVAIGTGSFADEQSRIIQKTRRYDACQYRTLMAKAHRLDYPPSEQLPVAEGELRESDFEDYLDMIEGWSLKEQQLLQDTVSELEGYVPVYESAVDILIATPGRLLEHLDSTLGFSLGHLSWLVLDEADKLLDGQYSNFLQAITSELDRPRSEEAQDVREQYLREKGRWNEDRERRVRKVVLSATMTTDISKLMELRLRRPQMVLVRSINEAEHGTIEVASEDVGSFELPPTLREYSVHAGDGSEKPLYLVQILQDHILPRDLNESTYAEKSNASAEESDSESDSSDSSDLSDSSSDNASTTDSSDADETTGKAPAADQSLMDMDAIHPARAAALEGRSSVPTMLIFASSTESAARLSHLLAALLPALKSQILTLTSATKSKALTKSLASISASDPVLAITTDRAARGLDTLGTRAVTHVLQYDVPRSATNYVHRVGRTARAGRAGEAWTLFTHSEAKWFVNEVVRNAGLKRAGGVEKMKVKIEDEDAREQFRRAMEELREGVLSSAKKTH